MVTAKTATMSGDRLFWGRPAQVRTARRFVVASLAGHPVAVDGDVVALLVSELVTNAVVHSVRSRGGGASLAGAAGSWPMTMTGFPWPRRDRPLCRIRGLFSRLPGCRAGPLSCLGPVGSAGTGRCTLARRNKRATRDRLHSSRASPRPRVRPMVTGWQADDTPLPRAPRRVTSCGRVSYRWVGFRKAGSSWTTIPPSSHCRCTETTFTT